MIVLDYLDPGRHKGASVNAERHLSHSPFASQIHKSGDEKVALELRLIEDTPYAGEELHYSAGLPKRPLCVVMCIQFSPLEA